MAKGCLRLLTRYRFIPTPGENLCAIIENDLIGVGSPKSRVGCIMLSVFIESYQRPVATKPNHEEAKTQTPFDTIESVKSGWVAHRLNSFKNFRLTLEAEVFKPTA